MLKRGVPLSRDCPRYSAARAKLTNSRPGRAESPFINTMADKEFTFKEVSARTTKKDLHLVIHDKVYDVTSFVDEHPYVSPFIPVR